MTPDQLLSLLPPLLAKRLEPQRDAIAQTAAAAALPPQWMPELVRVWACSDFVADGCRHQPQLLPELYASGDLQRRYPPFTYAERLRSLLAEVTDEVQLQRQLRRFRRREMIRIAWRDLAGHSDLDEVTAELSALADACIALALMNDSRQSRTMILPIWAISSRRVCCMNDV